MGLGGIVDATGSFSWYVMVRGRGLAFYTIVRRECEVYFVRVMIFMRGNDVT